MKRTSGSTLVEVLVAVTIISLVLTAVGAMMSMSVRLAINNEQKQLALHQAQEGLEFFRKERMTNSWYSFSQALLTSESGFYCMTQFPSDLNALLAKAGSCPARESLESALYLFQRSARVEALGPNSIKISVEVSWQDGKRSTWQSNAQSKSLTLEQNFENY